MLLHVDDLLNRVVDGLDLHDVLVVDQPEPELAAGAPAGVDALVAREGAHQLEGVLSHVFKDRVELRRWSGASSSAGSRSFGCSRLEQRSLGGKVFLELHNQGADVTTHQANQDRLDFVILARKDVGGDDALVSRGQVPEPLHLDGTLEDRTKKLVVNLLGHDNRVLFVTVNLKLEDADTAAAAVLLHIVDPRLELQDLTISVQQLGLEVGILISCSSQDSFQLFKASGLLVEPLVGGGELVVVGGELLTNNVKLGRERPDHLLQGASFFLASFLRHFDEIEIENNEKKITNTKNVSHTVV